MPNKNINQLPTAASSLLATDKMYLGRSPFGVTDDRYILGSSIITQFGSPLTTKGDIFSFSTTNDRTPVGTTNGQILQVNSAAGTGLSWSAPAYPSASGTAGQILRSSGTDNVYSSSTFADTYGLNTLLFAGTANTVGGATLTSILDATLANVQGDIIYRNATVWTVLGPGTAGQVLRTGGAAANPSWTTSTFPLVGGTAGNILISDGTNYIASTSLWPNTVGATGTFLRSNGTTNGYSTSTIPTSAGATANKVLLSDGTNYVLSTPTFPNASATAGKITISDGTNWIASTPTFPNLAGTAFNVLRSDGTNVLSSTLTSVIDGSLGSTQGNILYRNGTVWTVLAPGTSGQVLQSGGPAANPSWAASTSTLVQNHIFVGNASNVATDVAMSGDATIVASGALTIANNAVSNAKLAQAPTLTLKGNNTGGTANVADLTVSQVLTMLGLSQTPTIQRFTSGSGTYTTPANVSYIEVMAKGGGGGGGPGGGAGGGGGGEGGTALTRIISPAASYSYSVGAGGTPTLNGANSTFSTLAGGAGLGAVGSQGTAGGSASGGNINNVYGASGNNPSFVGSPYFGGAGGGTGGGAPTGSGAGANGVANSGGGGSGAGSAGGSGGSGGSGIIIVVEYYQAVSPGASTGTGNFVLGNTPTITTPNIIGVSNASNAAAGSVGELISSSILSGSAVAITSGATVNLTSISLTAGEWDLHGNVQFIGAGGAAINYGIGAFNTTSATLPDQSLWGMCGQTNAGSTTSIGVTIPYRRVSISSTTTYYIMGSSSFSGTCSIAGGIFARRIR